MLLQRDSRFGTDLGDVVINRPKVNGELIPNPTTEQFVETPPMEGAFDVISRIIDHVTPERFFVISKVKSDRETLLWLNHHDFYDKTGFLRQNLYFCEKRPQKGPISDELPGGALTHFVDDRADVLSHMPNVKNRFLFGTRRQVCLVRTGPFIQAHAWASIRDLCFTP